MGCRLCQKKIPQHLSKLGESTYGKIACMHLSNVDLLQENGSRLSLLESQPLMRGGGQKGILSPWDAGVAPK